MDPRAPGRAGRLRLGYLGLGSNEGDRLANLRAARDALARRGVEPVASSSVYETAPQGEVPDQPDFLNAALEIETELGPEELLDACKGVERAMGRRAGAATVPGRSMWTCCCSGPSSPARPASSCPTRPWSSAASLSPRCSSSIPSS